MNVTTKTLALLIDGDNAQLNYTQQIIQFCELHGTLSIKNAYGDWKQPPLSTQFEHIHELGVQYVQVNRNGKNATDFRLAMDVARMLEKGGVDIYFIVSSDGDFTTVCEEIRRKGAKVIGIGSTSNTSSALRKMCTLFFEVEEIVHNQTKGVKKASPAPKPNIKTPAQAANVQKQNKAPAKAASVPKPKNATTVTVINKQTKTPENVSSTSNSNATFKKLTEAYRKVLAKYGSVHLSQLKEALNNIDKEFETKRIMTWLRMFPDNFEVDGDYVRLK